MLATLYIGTPLSWRLLDELVEPINKVLRGMHEHTPITIRALAKAPCCRQCINTTRYAFASWPGSNHEDLQIVIGSCNDVGSMQIKESRLTLL